MSSDLVLVADNLFLGEDGEEADRAARPDARAQLLAKTNGGSSSTRPGSRSRPSSASPSGCELEPWLERAGCIGEEAARVRELLADRIEDGYLSLDRGIFKARKAG